MSNNRQRQDWLEEDLERRKNYYMNQLMRDKVNQLEKFKNMGQLHLKN